MTVMATPLVRRQVVAVAVVMDVTTVVVTIARLIHLADMIVDIHHTVTARLDLVTENHGVTQTTILVVTEVPDKKFNEVGYPVTGNAKCF